MVEKKDYVVAVLLYYVFAGFVQAVLEFLSRAGNFHLCCSRLCWLSKLVKFSSMVLT